MDGNFQRLERALLHPAKRSSTKSTIRTWSNRKIFFLKVRMIKRWNKLPGITTESIIFSYLCINIGCHCLSQMHSMYEYEVTGCNWGDQGQWSSWTLPASRCKSRVGVVTPSAFWKGCMLVCQGFHQSLYRIRRKIFTEGVSQICRFLRYLFYISIKHQ